MDKNRIKVMYVFTSCRKTGPTQQILNLIKNLDKSMFEVYFVTVYPENTDGTSILSWYLPYVNHKCIPLNKIQMMLGITSSIKKYIEEIKPDVIHSLGIFPDYMLRKYSNHVFTCRNYIFDDNPARYGFILGNTLAFLHLSAIKKTQFVQCCSESLHEIYMKKLSLDIPFIRNGVDIERYYPADDEEEKNKLKEELSLPLDKKLFIYGAAFNNRKNQEFLLSTIQKNDLLKQYCFLLIGDGPNFEELRKKYSDLENVIMPGLKTDISKYLRASDYYVSTSKSEGLPNGVLEAMASGLPVILSNIEQHRELLYAEQTIGVEYSSGDSDNFVKSFKELLTLDYEQLRKNSIRIANTLFSAKVMSENYQKLYKEIWNANKK